MTTNTKSTVAPYVLLCAALKKEIKELGIQDSIQIREVSKWVCFESLVNGHKFYVPKSTGVAVGLCETTLPIQHLNGARPMSKDNGKIKAKYVPELELISTFVLPLMVDSEERLPENKKGGGGKGSVKKTTMPVADLSDEDIDSLLGL